MSTGKDELTIEAKLFLHFQRKLKDFVMLDLTLDKI